MKEGVCKTQLARNGNLTSLWSLPEFKISTDLFLRAVLCSAKCRFFSLNRDNFRQALAVALVHDLGAGKLCIGIYSFSLSISWC